MTKSKLLELLKKESQHTDYEVAHINADEYLLKYINDKEIAKAFKHIIRLYA